MIKNKDLISTLGIFSLIFAVLLGRYVNPGPVINFLEGLLYGLAIVFNLFTLIQFRKDKSGKAADD